MLARLIASSARGGLMGRAAVDLRHAAARSGGDSAETPCATWLSSTCWMYCGRASPCAAARLAWFRVSALSWLSIGRPVPPNL